LYERNVFWGLIGLVVAIILCVVGAAKRDLRWLLFVAWLPTSLSLWLAFRSLGSRSLKVSLSVAGIILSAVVFYALYEWLTPPAPEQIPTAIFMECHLIALPVTIAPRSKIHLVALNKKRMEREHWGFYDIQNDTEKEKPWPDKQKMELSSKSSNFGTFGFKCEVSNHGLENIIYLEIPIDLWFNNNRKAIRYAPIVSSLDVAQSFPFYIVNDCPVQVSAAWQDDSAKAQTLREPKTHPVPLRRKYRNPAEQIMMFFPSTVQWVREQPCE